jgi:hypothetical protein
MTVNDGVEMTVSPWLQVLGGGGGAAQADLPAGYAELQQAAQKKRALLALPDGVVRLAGLKAALVLELARGGGDKKTVDYLDEAVHALLSGDRACLAALAQAMPDDEHRAPVAESGRPMKPNIRLRQFMGPLYEGSFNPRSVSARDLTAHPAVSFADVMASLATQGRAFASDHVHQGCLGNCYFCAALSLLAKFGRASLHNCISEVHGTAGRRFAVTFKKTKETRKGVRCTDVVVEVDDWFWTTRARKLCPYGGTHNHPDDPLFTKTSDRTPGGKLILSN